MARAWGSGLSRMSWITVVGDKPEKKLGDWWSKVILLQPRLQPDREGAADLFRNRLQDYVTG